MVSSLNMKLRVLVTGGAGYVGSTTALWLLDRGHRVWVLDNLSTGHLMSVSGEGLTICDLGDQAAVRRLFNQQPFDCVMHFAAKALVAESVANPQLYFENNVEQTRRLLEVLQELPESKRPVFIFSSTCAIFGDPGPNGGSIHENLNCQPINPYGDTKLAVERLLESLASHPRTPIRSVCLRYFNAAGADPKLRTGELHDPETHLIPNVLQAIHQGSSVAIFGTDYPTRDGTCIRDYIHVNDLAQAHEAAMLRAHRSKLSGEPPRKDSFNLGSETGFSVKEVIAACERVTGRKATINEKSRRPGDPPTLVANSALAKKELGFQIAHSIDSIVETAWQWTQKQSQPKKAVFLDRDGTINEDPGYLDHRDKMKLLGGVGEALQKLKRAGFELVVVSNQSGVGRGIISPEELPEIHRRMDELLSKWGVQIDDYSLCIHRPEDQCPCRKPKPHLLLDAAKRLRIDLAHSYMVGDKPVDLEAGKNSGVRGSLLVRTGHGRETEKTSGALADFIGEDLLEVANWILSQET
ncbi:MAG: UDP-glucose 4-epimerase GalE [Bdellovibrionales bacterium]|nr:UDP-glucose 4-epimerase GalE [Bdellovibrionales bacterium]